MEAYCKTFEWLSQQNWDRLSPTLILAWNIFHSNLEIPTKSWLEQRQLCGLWRVGAVSGFHHQSRAEICHDRRDRRSCKICASCVNYSRKQRVFCIIFVEVHHVWIYNETVEISQIQLNLNKKWLNWLILMLLHHFILSNNGHNLRTFIV